MSDFVYKLIVYIVEGVISTVYMSHMLSPKYSRTMQVILQCEINALIAVFCPSLSPLSLIVISASELIFVLLMYEDKIRKRIGIFLIRTAVGAVSLGLSYLICKAALDSFDISIDPDGLMYANTSLIVFSCFVSLVFQLKKGKRGAEFFWITSTLLVLGVGQICAVLTSDGSFTVAGAVALACMIASELSVGILAPYLLQKITMSTNMYYGQTLSNMEYKYYEMSVENEKKLREMRHDISNQIQTICSLFASGHDGIGREMMQELRARYALVDQMIYCKNPVINVILSNKRSEAEGHGIETHIRVKEELDDLPITNYDLSTVICNLADNAIRGCLMSEQSHPRFIVEILQKNMYLVVRVLNSCKINMVVENTDRLETTKNDTPTHGLGMPIIASIAKKYRGDFIVSAQNGIFTATVVMSIKNG